jgi:hypothetical protein
MKMMPHTKVAKAAAAMERGSASRSAVLEVSAANDLTNFRPAALLRLAEPRSDDFASFP